MLDQLQDLRSKALDQITGIKTLNELEEWKVQYLGRERGELTAVLKDLRNLPSEQRPAAGQAINAVKNELELKLQETRDNIQSSAQSQALEQEKIDITLPGRTLPHGHMHPVSRIIRDISRIFTGMGFQVIEGPEVETDYYNFQALNIPQDHPARDMQATFWIDPGKILLRTQTSPNQIHIMEKTQPPVRAIVPGKVYRYEAIDATHEAMFHQIEGLLVDEHCTMSDLKGVLERFTKQLFGEERKVRFRASYFPFTEPSAEMDMDCMLCGGSGCRVCKYNGWVELLGSGMVHPQVLRNVGYDPNKYRGFAFGMGVERIAMLKYGIDEIRLYYGNDLRFLKQFP